MKTRCFQTYPHPEPVEGRGYVDSVEAYSWRRLCAAAPYFQVSLSGLIRESMPKRVSDPDGLSRDFEEAFVLPQLESDFFGFGEMLSAFEGFAP